MADKIKISEHITGLHRTPTELSTKALDETLVIMSHGYPGNKSGHNDLFGDVEFILADKGYHSLRFDYRGCGESNGREQDFTIGGACEDFQNVLFWAKSNNYKRFVYVGEGIGASLAIMNHDLDVSCYILLWPALDFQEYREYALDAQTLSDAEKKQGFIERDQARIGLTLLDEMDKTDITYALKEIHVPTLIMHGARDKKIPMGCLDMARAHMRSKRIEITSFHDGEHGLTKLNHRKAMFYHIQQFIEKYV